jgi:hypothetical protein
MLNGESVTGVPQVRIVRKTRNVGSSLGEIEYRLMDEIGSEVDRFHIAFFRSEGVARWLFNLTDSQATSSLRTGFVSTPDLSNKHLNPPGERRVEGVQDVVHKFERSEIDRLLTADRVPSQSWSLNSWLTKIYARTVVGARLSSLRVGRGRSVRDLFARLHKAAIFPSWPISTLRVRSEWCQR